MLVNVGEQQKQLAESEQTIYQALAAAGLIDAPCGGKGRCGKCAVRFITAPPPAKEQEQELFSATRLSQGWRLSCLHQMKAGQEIELPQSGAAEVEGAFWGGQIKVCPDAAEGLGLALDIGTTTLAAALFSRESGQQLAAATCLNSQKAFGQDVVSRIQHAQTKPEALSELQEAVLKDIRCLLHELSAASGLKSSQITLVGVAANPTMIHLLAGVNPLPLGRAPYRLVLEGEAWLNGDELGLDLAPAAKLYCLPAVAAYLGGDIVGGMLAVELHKPGSTRLFIDIGTNGEIVLARAGQLIACSTAAGPALEGMNIRCGMRAAQGAVDDLWLQEQHVAYTTIGGQPPVGLAGSGILAAVSALRQGGLLDYSGRLQAKAPITESAEGRRLLIDEKAEIMLTQADIRQVQLSKGAILAGIETLLAAGDCPPEAVDEILVAGGFGAHLPEQSLLFAGLLPRAFAGKIRYLGNSSLAGARLCLLSQEQQKQAEQLCRQVRYIELAQEKDYQERFVLAMCFE